MSPTRYTPRHARASKTRLLLLFAFSNKSEAHGSVHSEIILIRERDARVYMRLPFELATPPGFHATQIPRGNLVHLYSIIDLMSASRNSM